MQPLQWERRPDGLRAPALVCAFKGWNDAGDAASTAVAVRRQLARRDALRADRPGGVLRLPGDAAAGALDERGVREITWPDGRDLRGARAARAARPRADRRARAVVSLAHVLPARGGPRRGARRAAGRLARRAAGGRRRTRARSRVTGIASDRALVERLGLLSSSYEGPTGIVGVLQARAPRPACRRRACGRRCRTTSPARRTRRPRSRSCASSKALVGVTVDARRARAGDGRLRAPGQPRGRRATPTCRRSSSASSSAADEEERAARPPRPPLRRPHRQRVPALPQAARRAAERPRERRARVPYCSAAGQTSR